MAIVTLISGNSGEGKSYSLKNLDPNLVGVINVVLQTLVRDDDAKQFFCGYLSCFKESHAAKIELLHLIFDQNKAVFLDT